MRVGDSVIPDGWDGCYQCVAHLAPHVVHLHARCLGEDAVRLGQDAQELGHYLHR